MIHFVRGTVFAIEEDSVIMDLSNVGVRVLLPLIMTNPRPILNEEFFLYTHMQIREDAWTLFGFSDQEQLEIFQYLINVNGIGAKTALAILNTLSKNKVIHAVQYGKVDDFCAAPGIGKKTAQRIILELKDKFSKWSFATQDSGAIDLAEMSSQPTETNEDLLLVLMQLGYGNVEARRMSQKAIENLGMEADINLLLKEALRMAVKY